MALKFDYESPDHQISFKDAYMRIVEGFFTSGFLHLIVSIYANENTRNKQKEFDIINKEIDDLQGRIYDAKAKIDENKKELSLNDQRVSAARQAFDAGKLDKNKLAEIEKDAVNFIQDTWSIGIRELENIQKSEEELREKLKSIPKVQALKTTKYSFPLTENELNKGSIYQLAYDKLKGVVDFKNAKNV